jgi:hypothetical protein
VEQPVEHAEREAWPRGRRFRLVGWVGETHRNTLEACCDDMCLRVVAGKAGARGLGTGSSLRQPSASEPHWKEEEPPPSWGRAPPHRQQKRVVSSFASP